MEDLADYHLDLESGLEMLCEDKGGILLRPNEEDERAVLNPAIFQTTTSGPWPFLYRAIKKDGISVIKCRQLLTPTQLGEESRVLIKPTEPEELFGCEDPRLTKINGSYFITYTAYDGINARIGIAETEDFENVEKLGFFGPKIELERAIKLVPDKRYKEVWKKHIVKSKERGEKLGLKVPLLLWDKDASIHYENGEWILIHRLEPHIHIARADKLEDLKEDKNDFWGDYLRNITKHEFIRAGKKEGKRGLGSPPIRIGKRFIGTYHSVFSNGNSLDYGGNFFEVDDSFRIKSILRDLLFKPESEESVLEEYDKGKLRRTKRVVFPTGIIRDPKERYTIWIYLGVGDKLIGYRSTSLKWLSKELEHPGNMLLKAA